MLSDDQSDFYVELRSFDSLNVYPSNIISNFRIQLAKEMKFRGQWQVSIIDFVLNMNTYDSDMQGKDIYVFTDVIDYSLVGSNFRPILRRLNTGLAIHSDSRTTYINQAGGCYKNITVRHCMSIEITLENAYGKPLNLVTGSDVSLTLHFRHKPK